jgi:hypothetical protein
MYSLNPNRWLREIKEENQRKKRYECAGEAECTC